MLGLNVSGGQSIHVRSDVNVGLSSTSVPIGQLVTSVVVVKRVAECNDEFNRCVHDITHDDDFRRRQSATGTPHYKTEKRLQNAHKPTDRRPKSNEPNVSWPPMPDAA